MNGAPFVTTVIATYSRARLLRRAIRSALAQTLPEVRVAVYDNASPDETEAVVRAIADADPRVTYHRHQRNIGAASNYNFGLQRVTTPYFSLLGDDDILLPRFYEEAVAALDAHPECAFFCARTAVANEHSGAIQHRQGWPTGVYAPSPAVVERMIGEHFINTAVVFRRSVLDDVGLFDHLGSDRNFIVLAAARFPFVVSESEGGVMTIHESSFSGGGSTDFGSGVVQTWGAGYLLDSHAELAARLTQLDRWSVEAHRSALDALRRQTLRDLLYVVVTSPDPQRFRANLAATRDAARTLGLGLASRAALDLASRAASVPLLRSLGQRIARGLWRTMKRSRRSGRADAEIRTYLERLEGAG